MIRAVVDANVLVSGIPYRSGPTGDLVRSWLTRRFRLVLSEHLLREIDIAWQKPYWRTRVSESERIRFNNLLWKTSEIVTSDASVHGVATHWQDDLVLATALNGNADYVVTGDKELLRLERFEGIEIVSPAEFLVRLDEQPGW